MVSPVLRGPTKTFARARRKDPPKAINIRATKTTRLDDGQRGVGAVRILLWKLAKIPKAALCLTGRSEARKEAWTMGNAVDVNHTKGIKSNRHPNLYCRETNALS